MTDTLSSVNNGHTFQDSNNGIYLDFRVTGTAAAINGAPEPRTTGLLFGASILFGSAARSRLLGRRS